MGGATTHISFHRWVTLETLLLLEDWLLQALGLLADNSARRESSGPFGWALEARQRQSCFEQASSFRALVLLLIMLKMNNIVLNDDGGQH